MAKEDKEEVAAAAEDEMAKLRSENERLEAENATLMASAEVEEQLKEALAEKELLQEEKDRLAVENAALVDENAVLNTPPEPEVEETYEDWTDDGWVNPRARPIPKKGDWVKVQWRDTEATESPRKVLIEGMVVKDKFIKGRKPKGSKAFFWNRDPTKLSLREVDLKEGPARIHFGEIIELTPDLIQRNRVYIEDGSLGPRRRYPVRRSLKTRQIVETEMGA